MLRPTRTAGGIAALALALIIVALLLENPAAALAAGSLAIFLLWRGLRFETDLSAIAASLTVNREVDRTILRQGTAATVRVRVDLTALPGMDIMVRDIPPAVAIGDAPASPPAETAIYAIRLMAPGKTSFGGVVIEAADALFTASLTCRSPGGPEIQVFPSGVAGDGRGIGAGGGDSEVDRRTAITGQSILGFRPYQSGDDPGLIDWKVTARRGTLYVRQMTGLEGGAPLITVDLPPRAADPEIFARFSMAVSGAVEGAITSRDGCSLLVVAGPEIIRFFPRTMDLREAIAALGGLAPIEPRNHLYRAPGPAILAARARVPRQGKGAYPERLGVVLSAFAGASRSPFAASVREALTRAEALEVRIYSLLPPGDKSHLVQVIHQAKAQGMRVVMHAPAGAPLLPDVDALEVL